MSAACARELSRIARTRPLTFRSMLRRRHRDVAPVKTRSRLRDDAASKSLRRAFQGAVVKATGSLDKSNAAGYVAGIRVAMIKGQKAFKVRRRARRARRRQRAAVQFKRDASRHLPEDKAQLLMKRHVKQLWRKFGGKWDVIPTNIILSGWRQRMMSGRWHDPLAGSRLNNLYIAFKDVHAAKAPNARRPRRAAPAGVDDRVRVRQGRDRLNRVMAARFVGPAQAAAAEAVAVQAAPVVAVGAGAGDAVEVQADQPVAEEVPVVLPGDVGQVEAGPIVVGPDRPPVRLASWNCGSVARNGVPAAGDKLTDADVIGLQEINLCGRMPPRLHRQMDQIMQGREGARGGGVGIAWDPGRVRVTRDKHVMGRVARGLKQAEWLVTRVAAIGATDWFGLIVAYFPPGMTAGTYRGDVEALMRAVDALCEEPGCSHVVVAIDANASLWAGDADCHARVIGAGVAVSNKHLVSGRAFQSARLSEAPGKAWRLANLDVGWGRGHAHTHVQRAQGGGADTYSIIDYIAVFARTVEAVSHVTNVELRDMGGADHRAICCQVRVNGQAPVFVPKTKWSSLRLTSVGHGEKVEAFKAELERQLGERAANGNGEAVSYDELFNSVKDAGNKVLGVTKPKHKVEFQSEPWWDDELLASKRNAKRASTAYERVRRRAPDAAPTAVARDVAKVAATAFGKLVKAKKKAWFVRFKAGLKLGNASDMRAVAQMTRRARNPGGTSSQVPYTENEMANAWRAVVSTKPPAQPYLAEFKTNSITSQLNAATEDQGHRGRCTITVVELKEAINASARNKAPGLDGVTNEVFKAMGDSALGALASILSDMLCDPAQTERWKRSLVALIAKQDDPGMLDYRPITLLEHVAKLLEAITLKRMMASLPSNALAASQAGFREARSTVEHIWRLHTTSEQARDAGLQANALFTDIRKAFDVVPWFVLVQLMIEDGVPLYLCNFVWHWIRGHSRRLMVGDWASSIDSLEFWLDVLRGVPQGSVLGPTLFLFYIDRLVRRLERICKKASDIHAANGDVQAFLQSCGGYADDLYTLTTARTVLEQVAKACDNWANMSYAMFAPEKCEQVVMAMPPRVAGGPVVKRWQAVKIHDTKVKLAKQAKHLGVMASGSNKSFVDQTKRMKSIKAFYSMSFHVWGASRGCPLQVGSSIVRAVVDGSLLYAAEAASINLVEVERERERACRKLLGAYKSDHGADCRQFLGWTDVAFLVACRRVNFTLRLMEHPWLEHRLHLRRQLLVDEPGHFKSYWSKAVESDLELLGIDQHRFLDLISRTSKEAVLPARGAAEPVDPDDVVGLLRSEVKAVVDKAKQDRRQSGGIHPLALVGLDARFCFPFFRGHLHPRDWIQGVRRLGTQCDHCLAPLINHIGQNGELNHLLVACTGPKVVRLRERFKLSTQRRPFLANETMRTVVAKLCSLKEAATVTWLRDVRFGEQRCQYVAFWCKHWWRCHATAYRRARRVQNGIDGEVDGVGSDEDDI